MSDYSDHKRSEIKRPQSAQQMRSLSIEEFVTCKPIFGIAGYRISKYNHDVDKKFSSMQARSRIGKDENSNFMKAHLKITSNIPAPNKYIINAAPSTKHYRVYAHDNRSYFADIQYQ